MRFIRFSWIALLFVVPTAQARLVVSCSASKDHLSWAAKLVLEQNPASAGMITDTSVFSFWVNQKRVPAEDLKSVRVYYRQGHVHKLEVVEVKRRRDEAGEYARMVIFDRLDCPVIQTGAVPKSAGDGHATFYRHHGTSEGYVPEPGYFFCNCAVLK
jgi:hypothetical protein